MPFIVVSGALANKPGNGGAAWTRLSWILGLKRLVCEVYCIEQVAPVVMCRRIASEVRRRSVDRPRLFQAGHDGLRSRQQLGSSWRVTNGRSV